MSDSPISASATPLNPRRRGLIIGASVGLGAELARKLSREGYSLALIARSEDKLNDLSNEIRSNGGYAQTYVHDVTEYEIIPDLLRKIVADLGGPGDLLKGDLVVPPAGKEAFGGADDAVSFVVGHRFEPPVGLTGGF